MVLCAIHGKYEFFEVLSRASLRCPTCTSMSSMRRIENACDRSPYVDMYWRQPIKCIDMYNYPIVRELIPEQMGLCTNGRKFMIFYDDAHRFFPMPRAYPEGTYTDFADEVYKHVAKMNFASKHGYSVLRISFEEWHSIDYWVSIFLEKVASTNIPVFMCSNERIYNKLEKNSECYLGKEHMKEDAAFYIRCLA